MGSHPLDLSGPDPSAVDHAWIFDDQAFCLAHAGQVVVIDREKVWGSGRDHLEALQDAQRQPHCPDPTDLTFVVIPETVWFEDDRDGPPGPG
jgi:hypothetical protein